MNSTPPSTLPVDPLIEMQDATLASVQDITHIMLRGVNWKVQTGDVWVVGGLPNSGKSDLLAAAAGLVRPVSGQVRLFGRNTAEQEGDALLPERLRIGLVFGDGGRLFGSMSVLENIALPIRYHKNASLDMVLPDVETIMKMTGIDSMALHTTNELNRGWRQRVSLARALMMRPDVLLFDNPLNGLDPLQIRWWLDFLAQLTCGHPWFGHRPATLVVVADNLQPWLRFGTQFAMLHQAQWLPMGGREAIGSSKEPLWADLLAGNVLNG